MKVQAHSSLELSLELNQNQTPLTDQVLLGVTKISCSFRLVLEGRTSKEISESSRIEFLEKFLANNFALQKTTPSGHLIEEVYIADSPSPTTLLAIPLKS